MKACNPSPKSAELDAVHCRGSQSRRIPKHRSASRVFDVVAFGLVVFIYCTQPAFALPDGQQMEEHETVLPTDAVAHARRVIDVGGERLPHGQGHVVEFLSPIAPQGKAVAEQEADKESQKGQRRGLEKFAHEHPLLRNLVIAIFTLVAGFIIGSGGFGGAR